MSRFLIPVLLVVAFAPRLSAAQEPAPGQEPGVVEAGTPEAGSLEEQELVSEPLIVPLVSSDPKLATSAGLMVGYAHQFDPDSPTSIFGVAGSYSTTSSFYYGVFANTFWGGDRHRLTAMAMRGEIKNDYDDFLGIGLPVNTNDDLTLLGGRYLHALAETDWFLGVQGLSTNYIISGEDALSQGIIDLAGLNGFRGVGLGAVAMYDTKDNQNSPRAGRFLQVHNIAYREALGGDVDFDAIHVDGSWYRPHGERSTTAFHSKARFSFDAPASGFSSIDLRGYTRGEYLAQHSILFEVDERWMISEKWGLGGFTGVAFLFGDGDRADFTDNLYPTIGGGAFYQLNDDRMVIRADIAFGRYGNTAFYLTFNQPF